MKIENAVQVLNNNKNYIIKNWLKNKKVNKIILNSNISLPSFIKFYALPIYSYYYDVLSNKNFYLEKIICEKLILQCKKYNTSINDIYIIYTEFKNILKKLLFEKEIFFYKINNKINSIFDKNLEFIFELYEKKENLDIPNLELEHTKNLEIIDNNILLSKLDLNFNFIYASEALCILCEYSKEEILNLNYKSLKHEDVQEEVYEEIFSSLRKDNIVTKELMCKSKNNKIYWVNTLIKPSYDENNKIVFYEEIAQDITLKINYEQQQETMIEQSKNAAMGEMISMIAHQWRQPLQAISILIQKLPVNKMIEGEISDEVLDQVLNDSNTQLEYMSKTIDDFRDYLKPSAVKEKFLLKTIIDNTHEFLKFILKMNSINFNIIHENEELYVNVHANEIIQVLINLIKNASDALISNEIENKKIDLKTYVKNDKVIIEVSDNAKGIDEKLFNKIFEAYFSTKSKKNGTGLGLYMSKKIIEQHNEGSLNVHNNEEGAVFEVSLPKSKS